MRLSQNKLQCVCARGNEGIVFSSMVHRSKIYQALDTRTAC